MSGDSTGLFPDAETAERFRVALRSAAGPASPADELIDRARHGARRRARRHRRVAVGAGVAAAVLGVGTVLSQSTPVLRTTPSAPALTQADREGRAETAFRSALSTAVPEFRVDGDLQVGNSTGAESDDHSGWEFGRMSKVLLPGTSTTVETTVTLSVAYPPQAASAVVTSCGSSDAGHGLVIDACRTRTAADGTRVDSGTFTSTFDIYTDGGPDHRQVSLTVPFATAWARDGVRVSATGGVVDGGDVPLAMGTTLPAGSPLTPESLAALVTQQSLLDLPRP